MCNQLFISDDSGLDSAVASLSEELINDYPASDPRWAESIPAGQYIMCEYFNCSVVCT
jgi:hypothetical protein